MAHYADIAELESYVRDQWIPLTDRDGDGIADADVAEAALTDADAEIDSFLGVRFDVPADPDPVLKRCALQLAQRNLYAPGPYPEHVQGDADSAHNRLANLVKGAIILKGMRPVPSVATLKGEADRTISDQSLRGFND